MADACPIGVRGPISVVMKKLIAAVATLAICPSAAFADISGDARILNGDTIQVGETPLRLYGIDAPEVDQMCENEMFEYPCGLVATGMLRDLVTGRPVTCVEQGKMPGGLTLAICYVEGEDLGEKLVRLGIALAHPEDGESYLEAQAAAQSANRSLWRGPFITPWDWRAGKR
tara:strand:- start:412 stop:927 length:516 start_codon:yes stop_codon:yes gene_type:complete